jgi:hypothetical protein
MKLGSSRLGGVQVIDFAIAASSTIARLPNSLEINVANSGAPEFGTLISSELGFEAERKALMVTG